MVAACLVVAVVGWGLGLFGASVYLHAITEATGWSIGLVSSAVTLFFLVGAFASALVGSAIDRVGPRPVIALGGVAMAVGVAAMGHVSEPWHVHAAFVVMGLGWAGLSTTAITTTLAPWFERYQGRAVSTALMGASLGAMLGVPALLLGIERLGFSRAMLAAGATALVVVVPLAVGVLRHRPQDLGLLPDGEAPRDHVAPAPPPRWTRRQALRTPALRSVVVTFGLGLMVQIAFITHHVALVAPSLGPGRASATVSATAMAALLGRVALARFSDRIDVRRAAGVVLLLGSAALALLALVPTPAVLIGASVVFGVTIGNVTTLSPIIVRREFGAASFGAIYGAASTGIQLASALGPGVFGLLRDVFGGYGPALLVAAGLDALAAAVVVLGGRKPLGVAA
jgi:MFS family permease